MPIDPLSAINFVWEALKGLVQGYEAGKKNLFESHVEPLHERMLAIHKDYVSGFEEVERRLKDDAVPPAAVIEFLEGRRRDFLAQRNLAASVADALGNAERRVVRGEVWASIKDYCEAISAYFSDTTRVGGISWYSDFIDGVKFKTKIGSKDVWNNMSISGSARRELLTEVRDVLNVGLPGALSHINKHYAVLRVKLL